MKSSISIRVNEVDNRITHLENVHDPKPEPVNPFDYDLLTEHEKLLTDNIHMIHDVAVCLGHGSYSACRYSFKGFYDDPFLNNGVFMECVDNFTENEKTNFLLEHEIYDKIKRLFYKLSKEEKQVIERYNEVARFFNNGMSQRGAEKGWWKGFTQNELKEAKLSYLLLMNEHGEKSFESVERADTSDRRNQVLSMEKRGFDHQ